MTPRVSVVVVSYQTRQLTVDGLVALMKSSDTVGHEYEVIVVDNASTDGSADAVTAAVPDARIVRLAANVGFARAVNAGAELARGDLLLFLNPDTTPVGDVIAAFVDAVTAYPGAGLWTGRTLRPDGADDGRSCFALPSLWSLFCFASGLSAAFRRSRWLNPEELPHLDRSRPVRVPAASGCLLLMDRALFHRLGGFAPDYFMYSEDIDLCARAGAAGAAPVLVPNAQVKHLGGAASTSVTKRVMVLRGKCTYLRLRWSPRRAAAGRAMLAAGIWLRASGSFLSGRAGYWREVWAQRATWLAGWPPVAEMPAVRTVPAHDDGLDISHRG